MSQIDQAFIQAYTNEAASGAPSSSAALPMAAEPVPAPHFRMAGQADAYADTASLQRALLTNTVAAPTSEPVAERRPLSSFAPPGQTPTTSFEPVFEVDAFRWPKAAEQLLAKHHDLLVPVVEQLIAASEEGRSLVGIAGSRPGVGCTTVQMCLARMIAAAGKAVVMVDADFASGNLARTLGLEFDAGWEDALTGKAPLAECVVRSIDDRMAVLPLGDLTHSTGELLSSIQTSISAGVLRYHYDLTLFDLGAAGQAAQIAAAQSIFQQCRLDSSMIVADAMAGDDAETETIDQLLSVFGATCLGVIGNCA